MTLNEFYTNEEHYFVDEDGNIHGLYQSWYDNDTIRWQTQINHSKVHGEHKHFDQYGTLIHHRWYEHGTEILDFLKDGKYPTTEEDRLIFKQKYQGEFIPN